MDNDLISRSEVIKTLDNIEIGKFNRVNVIETIKSMSTTEQPQGEWIRHHIPFTYMGYTHFSCSECNYGDDIKLEKTYNYCPNCGARMKGGAEE